MRLRKVIFIFWIILATVMFANGVYVLAYLQKDHTPGNGEYLSQPGKFHFESGISFDQPVNLLVLGLDEEELRTDVILLFNYNPGLSRLNILSITRDTRVYARGKYSKINALYSAGKEQLVADEIRQITGLPVKYYLTMNFKGFRKIIDALGGVEFNVPFNMDYDDPGQNLHIHLDKGEQLLDGDAAEQLVRYRKGNRSGQGYFDGDIGRISMQQEFATALIRQKMSVRNLSKVNDIFDIMKEYIRTNIGITDIAQYLSSLKDIKKESIKTFTLPGESAVKNDVWYYIYNKELTGKIINEDFYK